MTQQFFNVKIQKIRNKTNLKLASAFKKSNRKHGKDRVCARRIEWLDGIKIENISFV